MTVEGNNNIDRSHYIVIRCIARQKKYQKAWKPFQDFERTSHNNRVTNIIYQLFLVSKESILKVFNKEAEFFVQNLILKKGSFLL